MRYKNGREAKPGDKVIYLPTGESGLLHSVRQETNSANGRLAEIKATDPWVSIGFCLHVDDIAAADIPDSSAGGLTTPATA